MRTPHGWRYALALAAVALVYFVAARFGLSLAFGVKQVTAVWPPTGIALAALLLVGYRAWPAIAVGAFAVNALTDEPLATAAGIALGNTLEALGGAFLLRRVVRFDRRLERLRDVFGLAACSAVLSTALSATIGVASLCLGGVVAWDGASSVWLLWWIGDALGALVVAPLLLTWSTQPVVRWRGWRLAETVAWFIGLLLVSRIIFAGQLSAMTSRYPVAYAIFPFVIWAAFRFGQRETVTAVFVVSVVAIWGATHDLGPFASGSANERLVMLQLFMAVFALTALVMGAVCAERRKAERAVRESEERKAAILAVALDAIITMDAGGNIVEFNPAAEKMFGYTRAEAVGRKMADLIIPPSLRERYSRGLARYLVTREGSTLGRRVEIEAMRADGTEFPVEMATTATPLDGAPAFTGFVRDITASRRAEAERSGLLARELSARTAAEAAGRRLAFLANASEVLASSLDYQTTLTSLAELAVPEIADWCFVDMLEGDSVRRLAVSHVVAGERGLSELLKTRHLLDPQAATGPPYVMRTGRSELITEVSDDLLSAIARDAESLKTLREIGIHSLMCVPLRIRGEVCGILTFLSAESGRRYTPEDLALAEDIARRASLAIDNSRLYGDAQKAVAVREEFLAVASHELKTPITTLQLQLDTLLRGARFGSSLAASPDRFTAQLAVLQRQVTRLTKAIEQLLDFSRLTAGRLELECERVDLSDVVRDAVGRLEEDLARSGSTISVRDGRPNEGLWDPLRLEQVVTNLVSNAIKFGAGKPIEIALEGDARTAVLTVRDSGIGIDAERQTRLFQRFERAVSRRHYGGMGLGLWLVRGIVEAHGGSVRLTSQPGEGSTFTVELPRARAVQRPAVTRP